VTILRIGFLPSDFNPTLLKLGEAEDLRALGGVLRQFARDGGDLRPDELSCCNARQTRVTVTGGFDSPRLHPVPRPHGSFVGRLGVERATTFAEQVDDLTATSRCAGSELLECANEDEIPVKVSRGADTDDFL
jgi:hypothetical protein